MFVDVDMCKIVLIAGESADYEFSAAIFIELLKSFYEGLFVKPGIQERGTECGECGE